MLSKRWKSEWEKVYPDSVIDWKQVVSRYHYHYGADSRRDQGGEMGGGASRSSCDSDESR